MEKELYLLKKYFINKGLLSKAKKIDGFRKTRFKKYAQQVFYMEEHKNKLTSTISMIIDAISRGEGYHSYERTLSEVFYEVLTQRKDISENEKSNIFNSRESYDYIEREWKNFTGRFSQDPYAAWAQTNFRFHLAPRKVTGKDYNYYVTLEKTPGNIYNFMRAYEELLNNLKNLSDRTNQAVCIKIAGDLNLLLIHNDNLKIYFWDQSFSTVIDNIVKSWASRNNVSLSPRTHTFGVDLAPAAGSEGASYSTLLAHKLKSLIVGMIQDNISKGKDIKKSQWYYDWLNQNLADIIRDINQASLPTASTSSQQNNQSELQQSNQAEENYEYITQEILRFAKNYNGEKSKNGVVKDLFAQENPLPQIGSNFVAFDDFDFTKDRLGNITGYSFNNGLKVTSTIITGLAYLSPDQTSPYLKNEINKANSQLRTIGRFIKYVVALKTETGSFYVLYLIG